MSKRTRVLDWVQHCAANDVFVYYRTGGKLERDAALFAYMRKLSDGGLVFLFQRKTDQGEWEYCARRCRPKDHAILDKVSAAVQGPVVPDEDGWFPDGRHITWPALQATED